MNIDDLELFIAINEFKSISKASSELFISHSTLSYRLATLEAEMGKKLMIRGKGQAQLTLTDAGERFLLIAERICSLSKEAIHVVNNDITKLVISGPDSVNSYFMVDFYKDFVDKHDKIALSVLNGYSPDIPLKVSQGIYDIGISNEYSNIDSTNTEVLFEEEYVCLKRKFPDDSPSSNNYISPSDLDPGYEFYQKFDADYTRWHNSMFPYSSHRFNAEIARLNAHLLQTREAWAIMPYTVAKFYADRGSHIIYKLTTPPPPRVVYIITDHNRNQYNAENIELFKKELHDYTTRYFSSDNT